MEFIFNNYFFIYSDGIIEKINKKTGANDGLRF